MKSWWKLCAHTRKTAGAGGTVKIQHPQQAHTTLPRHTQDDDDAYSLLHWLLHPPLRFAKLWRLFTVLGRENRSYTAPPSSPSSHQTTPPKLSRCFYPFMLALWFRVSFSLSPWGEWGGFGWLKVEKGLLLFTFHSCPSSPICSIRWWWLRIFSRAIILFPIFIRSPFRSLTLSLSFWYSFGALLGSEFILSYRDFFVCFVCRGFPTSRIERENECPLSLLSFSTKENTFSTRVHDLARRSFPVQSIAPRHHGGPRPLPSPCTEIVILLNGIQPLSLSCSVTRP